MAIAGSTHSDPALRSHRRTVYLSGAITKRLRQSTLAFWGDNTMVCTKQFCSYRDNAEDFASLNATVIGISAQSVESHNDFIAKHNLNVPLLADEDKAVAKAYSATMPGVGSTARAVIVVDEQGIVRHRHDHRLGLDYQTVGELKAPLDALPSPAA